MSFNKILPFHFHKANRGKVKWMFKDLLQIRFWSLSFWLMSATKHWIHQQKKKKKTFSQFQLFWRILTRSSDNCNQKLLWASASKNPVFKHIWEMFNNSKMQMYTVNLRKGLQLQSFPKANTIRCFLP